MTSSKEARSAADLEDQLRKWRGTRTAALWLTGATALFAVTQSVMIGLDRESVWEIIPTVVGLIFSGYLFVFSRNRIRSLQEVEQPRI